jgi:hypothetical protein
VLKGYLGLLKGDLGLLKSDLHQLAILAVVGGAAVGHDRRGQKSDTYGEGEPVSPHCRNPF